MSNFKNQMKAGLDPEIVNRPPPRPEIRDDDPRARAARRAEEIREHNSGSSEGGDKFWIDPDTVPDGWSYEWKVRTVLNAENPAHQLELQRRGWTPVPASRHPEKMPSEWKGQTIEMDGMIMMERPKEITDEAINDRLRRARMQVRAKEEQLAAAPSGQFERANKDNSLVKVKKSFESMPIPEN
jgi:hypothetical protein